MRKLTAPTSAPTSAPGEPDRTTARPLGKAMVAAGNWRWPNPLDRRDDVLKRANAHRWKPAAANDLTGL